MRRAVLAAVVCGLPAVAGCAATPAATGDVGSVPAALVRAFEERIDGATVVSAASGDIDADGREDLAAVYVTSEGTFRTRALLMRAGGAEVTNEFKAPVEAQVVELRDIDGAAPSEVIVRGSKSGQVGYAIYRVDGVGLVDVFNTGMANCCGN